MRIFIDANILVAVLNKEYPLFDTAARLLSLDSKKNVSLFTSPICLAIAFYFAEKKCGSQKAKEKIKILCCYIQIASSLEKSVLQALNDPKVLDLEDGFEYYAALDAKCNIIITEDVADFHFSEIPIMSSRDFLAMLKEEV
ncbi:MAG: putative nucleic acid-binding protein [Cryomorphaceae bacterium]|jgi:predicted nucleic acid-binding protein